MDKRIRKRLEKRYSRHRELHKKLREHADDILRSEQFRSSRGNIQHGSISVQRHSIDVAKQSLLMAKALHISVNEKELVRGALLHDYFLYDWHDKARDDYNGLHGFYHPGIALKNAMRDFDLTKREQDIIKKHMWPLTPFVPMYRESWIVTMADKYCSTLETLKFRKGIHRGQASVVENKGKTTWRDNQEVFEKAYEDAFPDLIADGVSHVDEVIDQMVEDILKENKEYHSKQVSRVPFFRKQSLDV